MSIAGALLVAAGTTVAGAAPAATADGVIPDVTCVAGTETQTFDPGLRLFSQTVHFTADARLGTNAGLLPCVSTDPALTGGHYTVDVTVANSCLILLSGGPAQLTIHWTNGQHSELTGISTIQTIGGQSLTTVAGTVTSGQFANEKWRLILTAPSLDALQCASPPGITSRTGVLVEFIISTVLP